MQVLEAEKKLGPVLPNIARMLQRNAARFAERFAYKERVGGVYEGICWRQLYGDIQRIACSLKRFGFSDGDKMVLFSSNRLEILEMELAVMASGGVAVPIFANFNQKTAQLLIRHSDARFLTIAGQQQLENISPGLPLQHIFTCDAVEDDRFTNLTPFQDLRSAEAEPGFSLKLDAAPEEICLNMYTSGTMGIPKCVQLTHRNILSQRAAMDLLWDINENDRFLSYLPWHHSFGGIFELFTALYNGAVLHLESSFGKDVQEIFYNWKMVRPTVFFSVPKIYQALFDLTVENPEAERVIFHPELKFIFTAAAPLPERLSQEFEKRNIPVLEGWGLTETSPCCTITDPAIPRQPGIVGKPIPGVSLRLDEENEIQVKGPNVMVGYYKNDAANAKAFTDDGWFRTGDVGEFTPAGLKLITRKDRIFKLSNGEKVIPTEIESVIQSKCHFIAFALVEGRGEDYPVALLFPNRKLLERSHSEILDFKGCVCPRSLQELSQCLHNCLENVNDNIPQDFVRVKSAMLIDDELSIENRTLTPSMKVVPSRVAEVYRACLEKLYGKGAPVKEQVYIIRLNQPHKPGMNMPNKQGEA